MFLPLMQSILVLLTFLRPDFGFTHFILPFGPSFALSLSPAINACLLACFLLPFSIR